MYILGHIGLGYIAFKLINRNKDYDVSIALLYSLLPDIDILLPYIEHRGPTHSLLFPTFILIIYLILDPSKFSYSIPIYTHIFADIIAQPITYGYMKLLWPINNKIYQINPIVIMRTNQEAYLEIFIFIISAILFIKSDYKQFINRSKSYVLLLIIIPLTISSLLYKLIGINLILNIFQICLDVFLIYIFIKKTKLYNMFFS